MSDRDLDRFVRVFRLAAGQAGAVALRLQENVSLRVKDGQTTEESAALTDADFASQDVVLLALLNAFPTIAMDAEEDTESAGLFPPEGNGRPVVVVDPIDGTLNYSRGSRDFAVMGAWIEDGRYRAAVVHFPAWNETYWAVEGGGCRRCRGRGAEETVRIAELPPRILVTPWVEEAVLERLARAGFEVELSRCSAVDATAPAVGRARAGVAPYGPDRRRAVGFLLSVEAGGLVHAFGERWRGTDPKTVSGPRGFNFTADSEATLDAVLAAVSPR